MKTRCIKVTGIADADQLTAELAVMFRDGGRTESQSYELATEVRDRYRAAFSDKQAVAAADSEFMAGREAEYRRHREAGAIAHIPLLDYLGMTRAEYDDWKRTGIVVERPMRVWRRR